MNKTMNYQNTILVKDYFKIHEHYTKIYGDRCIIMCQVGSFSELYSQYDAVKNPDGIGPNLQLIANQLDIYCTKKNSNSPDSSYMAGVPLASTSKYIEKLLELNYTIVQINQSPTDPTSRFIHAIHSPATYIENISNNSKSTFLVSIVLEKTKNQNNLCIGLSAYDLSTGNGSTYETYSKQNDTLASLDDAMLFLQNFPPREVILQSNLQENDLFDNMTETDILNYLNIDSKNLFHFKIVNHMKIAWQQQFLESVYKNESNINIIERLELQYYNIARLSLVILLDYTIAHQPDLVKNLKLAKLFSNDKFLYLGNNAIEQLNVIDNNSNNLCNIINNTKTIIGKKYLMNQLTLPLTDITQLNKRYDSIDCLIKNNHYKNISSYLEDIYDLDKLIRKLEINIINPCELYQLYISFYQIDKLSDYFKKNNIEIFDIDEKYNNNIHKWIKDKFILDKINNLNFNNYTETEFTFYNPNIHTEIDELSQKINISQNFMQYLIKELDQYIDDKKSDKSLITLKYNDRDGYHLLLTNRRCEMLKTKLNKMKTLNINGFELDVKDLEFTELPKSSNTKINCKKVKTLSLELVKYKILLAKQLKEIFKLDMIDFLSKFGNVLQLWSKKIAYIDFINSGALCAVNNHYTKPIIKNNDEQSESYFKATELRHPIIEHINKKTTYVPHNIELGTSTEQNGILLYGINSSGKSTLMKSIGLNIILAQIGYFTASSYFEYFPYKSLFTRIVGTDNIFKGMSSFMTELTELMAILKRNNSNTLIIGDEICKGTEIKSANIIISYMLETLSKSKASFITATHLHDLVNMESVKKINNIKIKHLKLTYDPINDTLIYDRYLLDGPGEYFYGLQVAKYLMKDNDFNQRTSELLKEYDNINIKTSKYNSNIYLNCCEICKSKQKLETHHIVWQKEFKDNTNKLYLQKNDSSNLVVLCSSCHDSVDRNEIIINGWIETSAGIKFDYKVNDKIEKKSKYPNYIIEFIKNNQSLCNNDPKMCRIKLKEEFEIKISTATIKSHWII